MILYPKVYHNNLALNRIFVRSFAKPYLGLSAWKSNNPPPCDASVVWGGGLVSP
jgi:hypothetical protein